MATVISTANQKGGVGKTTTTMNLGVALARSGYQVLLVDSDPQANLTSYLGVTPFQAPYEELQTLDEVYLSKRPIHQRTVEGFVANVRDSVDLIAADENLSGVEYYLFSRSDKERRLAQFLARIQNQYDYILIDTPPNLNLLTLNALAASHFVIIPVQPEFFSLEGIVKIRQTVEDVKQQWNHELTLLGVLITQVTKRRKLSREVMEALKNELGELLFENIIHDNAAVTESTGHAKSVIEYQRSSKGAQDYLKVAEEVIQRTRSSIRATKSSEEANTRPIAES